MRINRFIAAVVVVASWSASGQTSSPLDVNLQRLQLNASGRGSLLVGNGQLLPEGTYRLSALAEYAHDTRVLRALPNAPRVTLQNRGVAHLTGAWAPRRWLELNAVLPVLGYQRFETPGASRMPALVRSGLGTPMLAGRFALMDHQSASFDLAFELAVGLPVGESGALIRDDAPELRPKLMVGRTVHWLRYGAEAYVSLRRVGALSRISGNRDDVTSHEAGVAGAILAGTGKLLAEIDLRATVPLLRPTFGFEILAGGRYALEDGVDIFFLAGPGLGVVPGIPVARAIAGLSLSSTSLGAVHAASAPKRPPSDMASDTDGDGIADASDKCVDEIEDRDRFMDEDGCPEADNDSDGVLDPDDRCPNDAGHARDGGCPSADGDRDGLSDAHDRCPKQAGPPEQFGCPVSDGDKDGVPDTTDACPSVAGVATARGCPASDSDGDGISDARDNCIKQSGQLSNLGCPGEQQLVSIGDGKLEPKEKVLFEPGRDKLHKRSVKLLEHVARIAREHPEIGKVVIEGHTDNLGNAELNRQLSLKRAEAVRDHLVKVGKVPAAKVEARGFGGDRPIDTNETAAGREKNRRIEFLLEAAR